MPFKKKKRSGGDDDYEYVLGTSKAERDVDDALSQYFADASPSGGRRGASRTNRGQRDVRKKRIAIMDTADEDDYLNEDSPLLGPRPTSRLRRGAVSHTPWVMYAVTLAQTGLLTFLLIENGGFEAFSRNPLLGPSVETLMRFGAKYTPAIVDENQWWRLAAPIGLHAGLLHLALNALFQVRIGVQLERVLGWWRVLLLYVLGGIGSLIVSAIFLPDIPTVGSSGACFALLGALFAQLFVLWRKMERSSRCREAACLSVSIVFSLAIGLLPLVDNFAHVGGLVCGVGLALALFATTPQVRTAGRITRSWSYCWAFIGALLFLAVAGGGVWALLANKRNVVTEWCTFCDYINCIEFYDGFCQGRLPNGQPFQEA